MSHRYETRMKTTQKGKFICSAFMFLFACFVVYGIFVFNGYKAYAGGGFGCIGCSPDCICADDDCALCSSGDCGFLGAPGGRSRPTVIDHHEQGETQMMAFMREAFHDHRDWIVDEYLPMFIPAMMLMTEQMSNIAMYQMYVVGKFFDAKSNLEAQRLFNELQNEAVKDYQPSESFCAIGTSVRSLSHSEQIAINTQGYMNQISMDRSLAGLNSAASSSVNDADLMARWEQFTSVFCRRRDNGWLGAGTGSGLVIVCNNPVAQNARANLDVDYHRLIEEPRHLDIDYSLDTDSGDTEVALQQANMTERAVIALSRNIYGHKVNNSAFGYLKSAGSQEKYLEFRSIVAKRNVAQNTYNAIVGMKARGSGGGDSSQFLRAVVADLGMTEDDINDIFGENPSYYGQLEILSKKIFQSTDFFTDLYDKPANVKRKQAALNAIELMLDRALFESELRNEMLMSVLLSTALEDEKEVIYETYKKAKP
jgi:hypothetical protein